MDVLTKKIDPHWAMMFANDLVLCAMTHEEVDEDLETWRVVFEKIVNLLVNFKKVLRLSSA